MSQTKSKSTKHGKVTTTKIADAPTTNKTAKKAPLSQYEKRKLKAAQMAKQPATATLPENGNGANDAQEKARAKMIATKNAAFKTYIDTRVDATLKHAVDLAEIETELQAIASEIAAFRKAGG